MIITCGPTGSIIKGNVLDVGKKSLEEKLRDYDPQLYLKWNPKKNYGWGVWELRRSPEKKSAIYQGTHNGMSFFKIDHQEYDLVNHTADLDSLNYEILDWLKKADTWAVKNFVDDLENRESQRREAHKAKVRADTLYNLRQAKNQIRGFKELVLSGMNPASLMYYWGKK